MKLKSDRFSFNSYRFMSFIEKQKTALLWSLSAANELSMDFLCFLRVGTLDPSLDGVKFLTYWTK